MSVSRNAPQIELPDSLEQRHIEVFRKSARAVIGSMQTVIRLLPAVHEKEVRRDAIDSVDRLMAQAESLYNAIMVPQAENSLEFVETQDVATDRSNSNQWQRQIEVEARAAGVSSENTDLIIDQEQGLSDAQRTSWIRRQMQLITLTGNPLGVSSIPRDAFSSMKKIIEDGIIKGRLIPDIVKDLRERGQITMRRAELIGTDQILTYHSNMTHARHTSIGVTHYIWRTSRDIAVRKSHRLRNGNRYSYKNPKFPTRDPIDGHPGQPIRCRCTASADLIGALRNLESQAA
jgi:SPP1 gp7 family putative phage head morphogenesis protein